MDLDGDGLGDILSGSYSRMESPMAGLFQVLWGQADGTFSKAATLLGTDGEPLIIPIADQSDIVQTICTRPTAIDWNGDGALDLVVGNFAGTFYWFIGEGDGKFQPAPAPLKVGDDLLRIEGVHSDPFVVDWDGDGDLDLVSGSSNGGVYWAENTAGSGRLPELKPFDRLIAPAEQQKAGMPLSEEDLQGPAGASRVWVDDVNEDGKLDVIVGDSVTLVSPAEGMTDAELEERYSEWQQAVQEAISLLSTQNSDAEEQREAHVRFRELYANRSEFMTEERTGFVWLYLQN